jgi:hypothetical protein
VTTTSNASLILGRGELFFDRFPLGTLKGEGELYLGNTPGFTVSRTFEEIQRFTSYAGQQIQIDSIITREAHSAEITTDNISMENLSLWFGSPVDYDGQAALTDVTEAFKVKKGRWYQLGTSVEPFGVRHVEPDIEFILGGATLVVAENLIVDRVEGRFYVMDDALAIDDGDNVSVTFQWRRSDSSEVTSNTDEVVGSLRYIPRNPTGDQIGYFFPYVRLKPKSQIDLKSDNWIDFSFDVEIRKLNPATNFIYVRKIAGPLLTGDEQAIIDRGSMTLDEFPYWEDRLNEIINVYMPAAEYGQVITFP